MIDAVRFDQLHLRCEGAIMIAGEPESPIRDVRITDSSFCWKRQGSLTPDCLDEQPSRRGVYPFEVPMAYIRSGEDISLRDRVRFRIDESMRPYIRETVVEE